MSFFFKAIILVLLGACSTQANDVGSLRGDQRRQLQSSSAAIVTLVTGATNLSELCYTFQTLSNAKGDTNAGVIVFYDTNSNNLLDGQKSTLASCTSRSVVYEAVDFSTGFPADFVPIPGEDYTYVQSQRFLISKLWSHPALSGYDVIMRVSDDTCLSYESFTLPLLTDPGLVYQSQAVPQAFEIARKYTTDLYHAAFTYISTHNISPKNIAMWVNVVNTHEDLNSLPVLTNDFEVVKLSFMQRPDVTAWLNFVTDNEYIYEYKWNTNSERFMTAAIFTDHEEISTTPIPGFVQKDFISGRLSEGVCRPAMTS